MPRAPSVALLRALQSPRASYPCSACAQCLVTRRYLQTAHQSDSQTRIPTPLRQDIKEDIRAKKASKKSAKQSVKDPRLDNWELTIGIEIHAELNTRHKLFSSAQTSLTSPPNQHVARFDAAIPGSQPSFQKATLLPAIRAALALNCQIQRRSAFDRKHYFWWDQPQGYQITQYYSPFAKDGHITLFEHDDIDPADGPEVTIGIKQVQMEQDTAKTVTQPPHTQLLDFNRVSHPLIEIITLPQLHSPKTAAALVRKIQSLLRAVDANTAGMELGGLRADVNVSVRPRHAETDPGGHEYGGITGLGQRTEIKNLSSFKAIEDAICAERDRQIGVLEGGGLIEGETRGWTLGSRETRRLRGKEGEVDYRYMPDPDLAPVLISAELVQHLRETMPMLPDDAIELLTGHQRYALALPAAKTLVALDDGARLDYYLDVVDRLTHDPHLDARTPVGKLVANWVLNDIPTHAAAVDVPFPYHTPAGHDTAELLATTLALLLTNGITHGTARRLLHALTDAAETRSIPQIIAAEQLQLVELGAAEYERLARGVAADHADVVRKVRQEAAAGRGEGKLMWLVGQMVRRGEDGRVRPEEATRWARRVVLESDA